MSRLVLSLALSLATLAVAAPLARADQQTATSGPVTATLRYTPVNDFSASGIRVTVTRGGATAYDARVDPTGCRKDATCRPIALEDNGSVTLTDLDGDGDPEVLLDLYTGGAHCCQVSRILHWDGARYVAADRNWGDPGYTLRDLDGEGVPELVSADDRFAYRYTSYVASGFPIQVWALRAGRLVDVTRSHPAAIRQDAQRQWRAVRGSLRVAPRGVLAAWAADRYLLGLRTATLRTLRRMAARSEIRRESSFDHPRDQRAWVRRLDSDLRRLGYSA